MNDYTGKVCPFCKTAFTPDDDIIVCSECDMPHHKDCWVENQGCTTFGCLGTIKAADHAATSVTTTQMNYDDSGNGAIAAVVYCTQCGTQNARTSSFCTHCGSRLVTAPAPVPQAPVYTQANPANTNPYAYVNQQSAPAPAANPYQSGGYNGYQSRQTAGVDEEVQLLVGKNTEYYVSKFQVMKSEGRAASWNWPAFWVAPYWMLYRKMYGYGIAVFAADLLISLFATGLMSFLAMGGYVLLGIFGNSIYRNFLQNKADQAKSMSEPYKSEFIVTNSGVNVTATVLAIVARVLLVGLISS